MKCTYSTYYKFQAILCLLLFVIASQLIKPSPFTLFVGCYCFFGFNFTMWGGSVSVDLFYYVGWFCFFGFNIYGVVVFLWI